MRSNKEIEEAVKQLTLLTNDKEVKAIYDYEVSARLERNTEDKILKEKAIAEGHAKGMKQGIKEGIEQGIERGIEQGKLNEKKK